MLLKGNETILIFSNTKREKKKKNNKNYFNVRGFSGVKLESPREMNFII